MSTGPRRAHGAGRRQRLCRGPCRRPLVWFRRADLPGAESGRHTYLTLAAGDRYDATPNGTHCIRIEAAADSDTVGGTRRLEIDSDSGTFVINATEADSTPSSVAVSGPSTATAGTGIELTATATGRTGLTWTWSASPAGTGSFDSTTARTVTWTPTTPGASVTLTATASDADGNSASGTHSVTVAPINVSIASAPTMVSRGQFTNLSASVTGAGGSTVNLQWSHSKLGVIGDCTGAEGNAASQQAGSFTLTATATVGSESAIATAKRAVPDAVKFPVKNRLARRGPAGTCGRLPAGPPLRVRGYRKVMISHRHRCLYVKVTRCTSTSVPARFAAHAGGAAQLPPGVAWRADVAAHP